LLKPISPAQLIAAIQKAESATSADELRLQLSVLLENINEPLTRNKKITLKTFERIYVTTSQDIIRFEADGNYTTVYLKDGTKIVVSKLLKDYEDMLKVDTHFFRVHQSHLINLSYLHFFEKAENVLIMKDKSIIPVAIRKRDQLLKLIMV
jgi:two-component system, LytTR family, response regulator